jgi:hypothetical protein
MAQVRKEIYDENGLIKVKFIEMDEPSVEEQIKESVTQSVTVSQLAIASGAVSAQVTAGFAGMATYVTESGPYKTVKGWLEDAIEYAAVPFKSAWATVKETAAKIGTKSV